MASSSTIPTNSATVQSGYVRHTPGGENEDITWRFNHWQDLSKKKSVTCNFCLETFTGGISRARKHQLGIPGEVKKCRKTPADAKAILQADYDEKKRKKEALEEVSAKLDDDVHFDIAEIRRVRSGKRPAESSLPNTIAAKTSKVEDMVRSQLGVYKSAGGLFGIRGAIRQRATLAPAEWWRMYGSEVPDLQLLAIKVLGLTCSASRCERNWSTFEHIHSEKRSRLEHKRLEDLVFVKYNQSLIDRYNCRDKIDPMDQVADASGVNDSAIYTRRQIAKDLAAACASKETMAQQVEDEGVEEIGDDVEDNEVEANGDYDEEDDEDDF
ncbi:hypothetical protein P8452_03742 [Trifolium repens]|nr:hypothetical protein P8452_03742 [Trifolium repens]